ncbi:MAG: hypothetical protein J1E98_13685 [Lachnospiraceae bacterium]|nr:hypothetical protein [Lachnospiraceae bacterium]
MEPGLTKAEVYQGIEGFCLLHARQFKSPFIINWIQYFTSEDMDTIDYTACCPFNHYESPFVSQVELKTFKSKGMYDMNGIE